MKDNFKIINGDSLIELDKLEENSIDSIVCDPPYELGFMGKSWDASGIAYNVELWKKALRVLKSGGYLLAFGGTRTFHRIACAIEDAGFEIRDTIMWLYGSGFPKSLNVGLAIDKKLGCSDRGHRIAVASRYHPDGTFEPNGENLEKYEGRTEIGKKWQGWGTALKPAYEPIIVARKPIQDSVAENVMKYGVGGINIDECRISLNKNEIKVGGFGKAKTGFQKGIGNSGDVDYKAEWIENSEGRFPSNIILTYDETDYQEVCGNMPYTQATGGMTTMPKMNSQSDGINLYNFGQKNAERIKSDYIAPCDKGSASRYFYCAKASKKDRDEGLDKFISLKVNDGRETPIDNAYQRGETLRKNTHPTVKPMELMQYLIRLVAPENAVILDIFMGSGSTGKAVVYENKEHNKNYSFIGIELSKEYCDIAKARIEYVEKEEIQQAFDFEY